MAVVALYGAGEMGSGIAQCLVSRDVDLHVYDPVNTVGIQAPNLHHSRSASEAARMARVHVIVLKHVSDVESLLFDESGLCMSAPPESLLVLHTTLPPQTVRNLHKRVYDAYGHTLVDAALSRRGGLVHEGSLSLFVGCSEAEFATVRGTLDLYADNVVHAGQLGAGMIVKLCNNWLLYSNRHTALQALRAGRNLGVDPDVLREALSTSTGSSWVLSHYSELDESIIEGRGAPSVVLDRTKSELEMAREMAGNGTATSSLHETFNLINAMR